MSVYLYKGVEPYLINTKIDMLVRQSKANEFNISVYDCSEVDIALAIQDAISMPFLCPSKVVIVKNPLFLMSDKNNNCAVTHNVDSLIKYLENPMEKTELIINACNIKINEKLDVVKALYKKALVNETKEIEEVEFKGWIKRQCDVACVNIEEDAIKLFYSSISKDLLYAKNELEKMINYVGENGTITKSVVNSLTSRSLKKDDIFELSSAILTNNKDYIYKVYTKLIENGTDVNTLMIITTNFMKDNLLVKMLLEQGIGQKDIAMKLGVSNNRAYYLIKEAKQMDLDKIENCVNKLSELDYQVKSGQIDMKKGFELFLFSI